MMKRLKYGILGAAIALVPFAGTAGLLSDDHGDSKAAGHKAAGMHITAENV